MANKSTLDKGEFSLIRKKTKSFIEFTIKLGFFLFLTLNISSLKAQTTILDDTNANPAGGAAKVGTVTIPANGYYSITVKGARGGNRFYFQSFPLIDSLGNITGFITLPVIGEGGKGGVFTTEFYLNQGTVLEYCLGAMGGLNAQGGGGGGGGTGIRIQSTGGIMAIAGGGGGFNQRAYAPSTEAQGYDAAGNGSGGSLDPLATSNSSYGSGGGGVNGAGQNANWDGAVNASIPTNTIPGVQSYGGGADFNAPGGYSYIGLDGNSTGVSGGGGYGGGGAGSYASYTANETNLGGGAGGGGGYTGGYAGNNVTFSRGGTSYNTGSNVSPFSATNDGQGTITIIQLPVPSLTTTDASCNDTNDGTVNIVIPGYGDRTKPFIYKITTANGTSDPQSSNVFNNVPAGSISVEVTDNVNQPIIMLSGTVGFNAPSLALNITTDFNANTDRIASSTLMANNKIFSPSKVTYKAGNSVSLNQGFEVKSGSTFLAQIGGCENSILTGLVAYYPFNGNANDETTNGNHGVPEGASLTTDRFGNTDQAYAFDGIDDMIQVAASESLNAITKTTISFWAYHNQVTRTTDGFDWQAYFSKDVFGKWFTSMLCTDPGGCSGLQPIILYHPGLSTPDSRYNWSSVSPNVWYHITVSNDGAVSKFYINGELKHSVNVSGSVNTNTSDLILGRCLSGSLYPLDGKLDDLRIYNRALTDAEIQVIYNAEKP